MEPSADWCASTFRAQQQHAVRSPPKPARPGSLVFSSANEVHEPGTEISQRRRRVTLADSLEVEGSDDDPQG